MKKFLFLTFFAINLFAVSGDIDYYISDTKNGEIIFGADLSNEANKTAADFDALIDLYNLDFGYKLANRPILAMMSYKNQIANAFAATAPFVLMTYYSGAPLMIDYFGYTDWAQELLAHEGSHLYQLDAKGTAPIVWEKLFGANYMPIVLGIIPLWTFPNDFLPAFIIEGNAVFNESRVTGGGRLYGGRHKALFLSLLKANLLTPERIINSHRKFPFGEEKYIVGGFFMEYLANKYGAKNVNSFFLAQGDRWINPFLLSRSYYENFGSDAYYDLLEFFAFYKQEASEFNEQRGVVISRGKSFAPLGKNKSEIIIYESDNLSYGDLIVFNIASDEIKKIKGDFYAGMPFNIEGEYYTAAEGYAETDAIKTSLFDASRAPNHRYDGKVLLDHFLGNDLFFKTDADFRRPALYEEGGGKLRFLGAKVSRAIYGADGALFTVRFEPETNASFTGGAKGKRVFYRDETRLFETTAIAALTDVLPSGAALFVAPTRRGNGLFIFQNNRVLRLGSADNILDARHIEGEDYMLTCVTAEGYETMIAKFPARFATNEQPFARAPLDGEPAPKVIANVPEKPLSPRKYYAPLQMRYSSAYPTIAYEDGNITGSIDIRFTDPLMFNALTIGGGKNERDFYTAQYENIRHLLFFGGGIYGEGGRKNPIERGFGAAIYAGYQIWRRDTSAANLTLYKLFDPDDRNNSPEIAALNYSYRKAHSLATFNETELSISAYARRNERVAPDKASMADKLRVESAYKGEISLGSALYTGEIFQSFARIGGSYAAADYETLFLREKQKFPVDPLDLPLLNMPMNYYAKEVRAGFSELLLHFETPFAGWTLPFGLQSISPGARYDAAKLALDEDKIYVKSGKNSILVEEKSAFADFEFLFAHSVFFKVRAAFARNSLNKDDRFFIQLQSEL
ncbi:MAG: hypothetical protein LBU73_04315 [Helicobacteraceae bacterium]|nr:hypothetical protein [Helicobacteraceae bacterium]